MTEAEFLAKLRTLPLHPGARGLADDVAVVAGLVVTTDTLVEGVHFLGGDPAADVAWKLVATNLSDLAAKGAMPVGVLLNYPLSDSGWDHAFLDGLREGLRAYDCPLLGGDTVTLPAGAPRFLTVTAFGQGGPAPPRSAGGGDAAFLAGLGAARVAFDAPLIGGDTVSLPAGAPRVLTLTALGRDAVAPPRSGARAGDGLWVTGTIGDAGAGLAIARGAAGPAALLAAYRRPQPRLADGRALAPIVGAMSDVSDGLLIDAARMATASGLAVTVALDAVPLSADYLAFAGADPLAAATAGDDYQLLFALAPGASPPVPATRVGAFAPGAGLALTRDGAAVALPPSLGWQHDGSGLR